MTDQALQELVRTGLRSLAGPPAGAADSRAAVERARAASGGSRSRRARSGGGRLTVWLAAAAVVALLAGAGAFRLFLSSPTGPAAPTGPTSPITAWPARGNLTHDADLIAQAEQVWRADAPTDRQPGQRVVPLYAGTVPDTDAGAGAAVLMLLSSEGTHPRVGIVSSVVNLSGPAQPSRHLVLRSVAVLDSVATTAVRSIGFVAAATPADHPGEMSGALGYVLLAPGITSGEIQSSMVDSRMTDTPGRLSPAPGGLISFQGFPGTGPWNSWVATPKGTPGIDVLAGAGGAPTYTAGTVDPDGTVTSDDGTAVHVGDLVVARDERPAGDGLLGVVTQVGHGADTASGTIDPSLLDLGRFGVRAVSYGSSYAGTLTRNATGGLVFTTDTPDAPKGVSRVVVQAADGAVTVNVGSFAGGPGVPNTASPFALTQTDTLPATGTRTVWIIATGR